MRKEIDLSRLRAAYRASGFNSFNQVAKKAEIVHTTIFRLFDDARKWDRAAGRGRRPRMNPGTMRRLAMALGVPPEWLAGEIDSLPFVPKHGLLSGKAPQRLEDVTEAKVRLSHLLARVDEALRRDLRDWYGEEAEAAYDSWGWAVLSAIDELASPVSWRVATVVPKDGDPGVFISAGGLQNTDAVCLLERALAPWFTGSAYLNTRTLRELFLALFKNSQRTYGSQHIDADIIRALELYDVSREGFMQEAAERGPAGRC